MIASVATRYNISTTCTRAFVHALRQISRLRPRQLITGRQRRRYPNSTSKTDIPLHNSITYRISTSFSCRGQRSIWRGLTCTTFTRNYERTIIHCLWTWR